MLGYVIKDAIAVFLLFLRKDKNNEEMTEKGERRGSGWFILGESRLIRHATKAVTQKKLAKKLQDRFVVRKLGNSHSPVSVRLIAKNSTSKISSELSAQYC